VQSIPPTLKSPVSRASRRLVNHHWSPRVALLQDLDRNDTDDGAFRSHLDDVASRVVHQWLAEPDRFRRRSGPPPLLFRPPDSPIPQIALL